MENQHRKIKGYRELNAQEIDLMNRIKEHGEKTGELIQELGDMQINAVHNPNGISNAQMMTALENLRYAKQHLQEGQMWLVRAIALPDSF